MRRSTIVAPVSLLSCLSLLFLSGAGTALAGSPAGGTSAATPRLIHTGNAYPDHPIVAPRIRSVAAPAGSGLKIVATFDSSITNDPKAKAIKSGIRADITALERLIRTTVTVHIDFVEVSTGLGGAATYYNDMPYLTYRSDLQNQASPSGYDAQALATLPATAQNPVNGGTDVHLTLPLLRAIGEAALGDPGDHVDSTIFLNTSIMNLKRTGHQNPDKYDLQQVAMHEIDEVLGVGGAGSGLASGVVGSTDLFRYSAPGVRSYTTDPNAAAYYSIDAGTTNRGYFNPNSGGDYGDWSSDLNGQPQVQDAFSTLGIQLNLDNNEKITFDVAGYHLRGYTAR